MTTPSSWTTKPVNTVQAIVYDGTPESTTAILEWASPLMGPNDSTFTGGMGGPVINVGDRWITPNSGDYVFLDADGNFFAVTPVQFEMIYKLDE